MRAGAHARGAQRYRVLCLRHSRRQTRHHGLDRQDGARVAPRRRRACAHAQTGAQRRLPARARCVGVGGAGICGCVGVGSVASVFVQVSVCVEIR
eukprot:5082986-Pleurochrysis_carterae.AAC.1